MKFFEKSWKYIKTGVDGNVRLFGVNIFNFEWKITNKTIQIDDFHHNIPVFQVVVSDKTYEFAADEVSNCVWKFYVYK
ncbi:MAG: hypothetical protein E7384_07155 [Ruminococcaceae bacterium]|nr:hypothetical protein [Oscillospiraceae bacterium]